MALLNFLGFDNFLLVLPFARPGFRIWLLGLVLNAFCEQPRQQINRQFACARGDMHKARTFHEFAKDPKCFVNVLETVHREQFLPFGFRAFKFPGEVESRLAF
jgi:hypothetical protein